ncbi:hypothetical protein ACOMHN_051255 [Nucella lapillus]
MCALFLRASYDKSLNPFAEEAETTDSSKDSKPNDVGEVHDNPFGDYDLDAEDGVDLDEASQGWAVRALYDYSRSEEDEIDFKSGEVFVQLSAEDEMGWCRGRKDGVTGLFPGNYVERI